MRYQSAFMSDSLYTKERDARKYFFAGKIIKVSIRK